MRLTLRQAADRATARARSLRAGIAITPRALARLAMQRYRALGGTARTWDRAPRWLDACQYVINGCRPLDWNPRSFVQAQVDKVGTHCVIHGKAMQPGMLMSSAAKDRFLHWHRQGLERTRSQREDDVLLGALLFGEYLISRPEDELVVIVQRVRSKCPGWSLAQIRRRPHLRLAGLAAAADAVDFRLADVLDAPCGVWGWRDQRERLLDILRTRTVAKLDAAILAIDQQAPYVTRNPIAALERVKEARLRLVRLGWRSNRLPTPPIQQTVAGVRRRLGLPPRRQRYDGLTSEEGVLHGHSQ